MFLPSHGGTFVAQQTSNGNQGKFNSNDLQLFHWESIVNAENLVDAAKLWLTNVIVDIWVSKMWVSCSSGLGGGLSHENKLWDPSDINWAATFENWDMHNPPKNGTWRWTPTTKTRDSNLGNHRFQVPPFVLDSYFWSFFMFSFLEISDLKSFNDFRRFLTLFFLMPSTLFEGYVFGGFRHRKICLRDCRSTWGWRPEGLGCREVVDPRGPRFCNGELGWDGVGWGVDVDVPCTCTHGRCYASHCLSTYIWATALLYWH